MDIDLIERFRGDRSIEDIIALMTMMQGQFDPTSLMMGMALGKGGKGHDRLLLILAAKSMMNANTQQQATGTPTVNPMQQMLPLLLLLRDDWEGSDRKIEVVDRPPKVGAK